MGEASRARAANAPPLGNAAQRPSAAGGGIDTPAYAPAGGAWWAMDVELEFDSEGDEVPPLFIKQARPFGNR